MVVYGDSHAIMWLPAFEDIATADHWKLVVLGKYACPPIPVMIAANPGTAVPSGPDESCAMWHEWAIHWINIHKPSLLVVTQLSVYEAPSIDSSSPRTVMSSEWQRGLDDLLGLVHQPEIRTVLLGDTPSSPGNACLAAHSNDVQACSVPVSESSLAAVERIAASQFGAQFIDPTPWFCSAVCTAVIEHFNVYLGTFHINAVWAKYLQNVLAQALSLPPPDAGRLAFPTHSTNEAHRS
jgi:hypothetical protein